MNIVLFVNRDFAANLAYNLLKNDLLRHNVRIYYSESVGKAGTKPAEAMEIAFYEQAFFYGTVAEQVRSGIMATDFEFFDHTFKSFDFVRCTNVNGPEFIAEIKDFNPDLFISIRFGGIFRQEIIEIPRKGILNLHSAILPDYRGIMGALHNLKDGKPDYGCTLHYIDSSSIDAGQIIAIAKMPVLKTHSLFWHIIKLYPIGCKLISESLQQLNSAERLPAYSQDLTIGAYYSSPSEVDFEMLRKRNIKHFSPEDYRGLLGEYISPKLSDIPI